MAEGPDVSVVPENGMCLSVFLVLRPQGEDRRVLFGRLDPSARWDEIGALGRARVASISERWMLPASHLLLFESPEEAGRRVAREQLGLELTTFEGSSVHSEAYRRPGVTTGDPHWDLHFVYRARWPKSGPPRAPAFRELAFLDLDRLSREEIARGHGDVLDLVGLSPRPG